MPYVVGDKVFTNIDGYEFCCTVESVGAKFLTLRYWENQLFLNEATDQYAPDPRFKIHHTIHRLPKNVRSI